MNCVPSMQLTGALFEATSLVLRARLLVFERDRHADLAGSLDHAAKPLASRLAARRVKRIGHLELRNALFQTRGSSHRAH